MNQTILSSHTSPPHRYPKMTELNSDRTAHFVQKKAGILPALMDQIRLITYP
jgi:hypothetical protein